MPTVGLLFGMEETFPPALRDRINELGVKDKVTAEFCSLDIWKMDEPKHYDAVLDRISQDVPFYRIRKEFLIGIHPQRIIHNLRAGKHHVL